MIDLNHLEKLAWEAAPLYMEKCTEMPMEYLTAANPQAILELIEYVRELELAIREETHGKWMSKIDWKNKAWKN